MKNIREKENHFEKGTVNLFGLLNIVTKFDIYTENTVDTVHIIKYRHFTNALHKGYIHSTTIRNKQTNNKSILECNNTFDITVQHEIGRGQA